VLASSKYIFVLKEYDGIPNKNTSLAISKRAFKPTAKLCSGVSLKMLVSLWKFYIRVLRKKRHLLIENHPNYNPILIITNGGDAAKPGIRTNLRSLC
jgi:hypothetical protein